MSACSPGHLLPCLRSSDSVPPNAIMKLMNLRKIKKAGDLTLEDPEGRVTATIVRQRDSAAASQSTATSRAREG